MTLYKCLHCARIINTEADSYEEYTVGHFPGELPHIVCPVCKNCIGCENKDDSDDALIIKPKPQPPDVSS